MKPETKKYLWDIAKTALIFAAIGACLAFVMPHVAVGLGLAKTTALAIEGLKWAALPQWQGAFFGLFGALSAGITPIVEKFIAGKNITPTVPTPNCVEMTQGISQEKQRSHHQNIVPEAAQEVTPRFVEQEATRRLAPVQNLSTKL